MYNEKKHRSNEKWNKENLIMFSFRCNKNTEADMIAHLNGVANKNAYIKALIRADMERNNYSE